MSNLFNMDNGFFTALGKICDMLFISVIWAILCIPIITIGPANTALYYVTVKVIRRERGYLYREFFKSFKLNFKRGAITGVGLTFAYVILGFDLYWAWANLNGTNKASILFGVFVAITFLISCFAVYIFPILSRFDMTVKQLLKAASFMSMRHLPSTVGILIITVAAIFGVILIPIAIFIIPAVATLLISFLLERVLKKYMPKEEEPTEEEAKGEETKKDEWYLE